MHIKRIAALVVAVVLAVFAVPAAPSFAAAGVTCVNTGAYNDGPQPDGVLARTCISWDDKPDGNRWTHYQSKVWNPANNGPSVIHAWFYANTGQYLGYHRITDGETITYNPNTTGRYTAKFTLGADGYGYFCKYMIPRDSSQTTGPC